MLGHGVRHRGSHDRGAHARPLSGAGSRHARVPAHHRRLSRVRAERGTAHGVAEADSRPRAVAARRRAGVASVYHRDNLVVASWMTRQDRELAIAENVEYVGSVLDAVSREYSSRAPLVFLGFSQGVGMAYRAAAHYRADALIALAGDVPPDVAASTRVPLPPILIGRGTRDDMYPEPQARRGRRRRSSPWGSTSRAACSTARTSGRQTSTRPRAAFSRASSDSVPLQGSVYGLWSWTGLPLARTRRLIISTKTENPIAK